jgi:hypothetical protein
MSKEEKNLFNDKGPHKFSIGEISDYFENDFNIEKIKNSVYYGTLEPLPKALFFVMKKLVKL